MVAPFMIILMFGAMEVGKFFLDAHVVSKSVRDGARYASRLSFSEYAGCAPSTTVIDNTRNITRTGQVGSGGTARLPSWTSAASVTVTVACDTSGTYEGIYRDSPDGAPVVTVSATVPYSPILSAFGFDTFEGLNLNSQSQATVAGV